MAWEAGAYEFSVVAPLTTVYVSPSGNDANTGTSAASPFRTLAYAFSRVAASGTVYLIAGTYTDVDARWHTIPGGTSFSNATTVVNYNNGIVTVRPSSDTPTTHVAHFYNTTCRYISITGIFFDGTNVTGKAIRINDHLGNGRANHIRFTDCSFFNTVSNGVYCSGDFNEFIECAAYNNDSEGIILEYDNNLVDGCGLTANGSSLNDHSAILIYGSTNVVRNSTFNANNYDAGIRVEVGSGNILYNNVFYSNYRGISVLDGATNTGVYNNTIYNNVVAGIQLRNSTGTIIRNNILYVNGGSFPFQDDGGATYTDDHNMAGIDPDFVDANNADFHLLSTSDARDNGIVIAGLSGFDIEGNQRDPIWDLGAYEFMVSGGTHILPPAIVSAAAVFIPFVRYLISLPTIATAVSVFAPTVTNTTVQTLLPPTKASGSSVNVPSVAYNVRPPHLTNTSTLNPPTMGYVLLPPTISSTVVIAPSVSHAVSLPTIASGSSVYPFTVFVDTPGADNVFPPGFTSTNVLNTPTVTVGAVTLLPPTIAAGSTVNVPEATYIVAMPTIASGTSPFVPVVNLTSQGVLAPTVPSGEVVYTPILAYAISMTTLASGSAVYIPGLEHLAPPTISSGSTVYAPAMVAYGIQLPTIGSTTTANVPIVAGGGENTGGVSFITAYMWKRIK